MGNPSIKIRIAGVVAAFAGASLLAVHLEWPPSTAADVNAELGRALAKETIQAIQPGGQVLAICRDTQEFPQPAMTQALRSFTKYLKTSGVEIRSIQSIAVDPLRPDEVPAGDFCEWIRKSKKSDVIVSFLGSPNLTEDQRLQLPSEHATIIAFCGPDYPTTADLRDLVHQNLLHVIIRNKPTTSPIRSETQQRPRTFGDLYERKSGRELLDDKTLSASVSVAAAESLKVLGIASGKNSISLPVP